MTLRIVVAAAVAAFPERAAAHAFASGRGTYEQFLEGAALPLHTPELALAVAALALLIGLWDRDGMPIVWPALIVGAALGLGLSPFAVFDPLLPLFGLALAAALFGAVALAYPRLAMRAFVAAAGGLIAYGAASGHGADMLPAPVLAGVFCGLNVLVAGIAGLAALPQRRFGDGWPRIGLRIAASWLAAITVMMLAFALR